MMPSPQPGRFIVLDGPDGSGKSTQIRLLADALQREGCEVVVTHEPGGTRTGNAIRELFLGNDHEGMTPLCELFLICAARAQHVEQVIRRALEGGKIVICDRFSPSTFAYQAHAGEVDGKTVREADSAARQGVLPDLTIIVDVPAKVGLARRLSASEADRMEAKGLAFHERVREGYLKYAEVCEEPCEVVDGQRTEDEVHEEIVGRARECLAGERRRG